MLLICLDNFTYNFTSKLCEATVKVLCPTGYIYNPSTKLCDMQNTAIICTNGFTYNVTLQKCVQNYHTNPNT